ncbi:hypothetical protein KKH13_02845 [Patescibacteria group bacterium]|nr:hypothetical protein [Patescibacteria group bacterium]
MASLITTWLELPETTLKLKLKSIRPALNLPQRVLTVWSVRLAWNSPGIGEALGDGDGLGEGEGTVLVTAAAASVQPGLVAGVYAGPTAELGEVLGETVTDGSVSASPIPEPNPEVLGEISNKPQKQNWYWWLLLLLLPAGWLISRRFSR